MSKQTFEDIRRKAVAQWQRVENNDRPVIFVGLGSCGVAHGARETWAALEAELKRHGVDAMLRKTGCIGSCYLEPMVDIKLPGKPRVSYHHITADKVPELVESVLVRSDLRPDLAHMVVGDQGVAGIPAMNELDFFKPQVRIVLRNIGYIDPDSIDDYIARGGYSALAKALFDMTPDEVIAEVKTSGIRGRGGAGFPCGVKWESARAEKRNPKFMVCNAHEGEPNVFKDRRILESDPHSVIEGIILGCYSIGTPNGYIYLGDEYPLAIARTKRAIEQAKAYGLLGKNILGTNFSCDIKVKAGGGGYVLGEGSALMFSIEGKRGMPRTKPPRSVEAGLWALPTSLNNVETLSNINQILMNGGAWYAGYGTEGSKGTKVFSLMGTVNRVGLVEVPMGVTLRELVFGAGGGVPSGHQFKAVQTGGPSGGCLPEQHLDLQVDFESLGKVKGTMGSGGFVVLDDTVCMVDLARYFCMFNRYESCGKCTPCRIGTKALVDIMDRIATGYGKESDLDLIMSAGQTIIETSLCGLGQTAPIPAMSMIQYFRDEFLAHIRDKRCPSGVCAELSSSKPALTAAAG